MAFLPSLTLLAFRSSPWQNYLRARPFNDSYVGMFIAATAGVGPTSCWILSSCKERRQNGRHGAPPVYCCRLNAFDLFEVFTCASLGILNFVAGALGSGLLWSAAFCLLAGTAVVTHTQKEIVVEASSPRTILIWTMSAFLVAFATLVILCPFCSFGVALRNHLSGGIPLR